MEFLKRVFCCCLGLLWLGTSKGDDKALPSFEDPLLQKMTFKTPELSEEEGESPFLPNALKCDGCIAVTWRLHEQFRKGHRGRSDLTLVLPEHEVLERTETACGDFTSYGITNREGVNRIKGPGLYDSGEAGISHMGGRLPGQMRDMCLTLTSAKTDEMTLYNHWRGNGKSHKTLIDFFCKTSVCEENHPAYRPISEILQRRNEL